MFSHKIFRPFFTAALGASIIYCPMSFAADKPAVISQMGLLAAVEAGAVAGDATYGELSKDGDFGVGTFNNLDGEMVALDGKFYQYWPGGKTKPADLNSKTPFAEIVKFKKQSSLDIPNTMDFTTLQTTLDKELKNKNIPYAIRIDGEFQVLKLNSRFPVGSPEAADPSKRNYQVENVKGTLVGFWFPGDLVSLTRPGYHFHFISSDKKVAGHVLDFTIKQGKAEIQPVYQIHLQLPNVTEFANANVIPPTPTSYEQGGI